MMINANHDSGRFLGGLINSWLLTDDHSGGTDVQGGGGSRNS
jgi:hypothetical protein